jgi:hypothetical protein
MEMRSLNIVLLQALMIGANQGMAHIGPQAVVLETYFGCRNKA